MGTITSSILRGIIERMRIRTFRLISTYLQCLSGIVTVLIVLSPKWGPPGDFYLGFPQRFYVTQEDVLYPGRYPVALLYDLIIVGVPVFAVVFGLIWLLSRLTLRAK